MSASIKQAVRVLSFRAIDHSIALPNLNPLIRPAHKLHMAEAYIRIEIPTRRGEEDAQNGGGGGDIRLRGWAAVRITTPICDH